MAGGVRIKEKHPCTGGFERGEDWKPHAFFSGPRCVPEILEALIKAGADVTAENEWGDTGLRLATKEGDNSALQILIKASTTREASFQGTPLQLDSDSDERVIISKVEGCDDLFGRNTQGETGLHLAAQMGSVKIIHD